LCLTGALVEVLEEYDALLDDEQPALLRGERGVLGDQALRLVVRHDGLDPAPHPTHTEENTTEIRVGWS
jgi:hypothetical protein